MRRFLPLGLLAALMAVLVAGCGGVSLDPVARAASKTADAGSFRFSFSLALGIGAPVGTNTTVTGDGAWDASSRRLQVRAGVASQRFEAILDVGAAAAAFYVKAPAAGTWTKVDLADAAKQGGVDLGALASAQLDPKQLVEVLKQAGTSTRVGDETVDGVQTTHYRVDVDARKALEHAPAQQRQAGEQALKLTGAQTLPVDVWVDGDGYLRRVAVDVGGKDALFSAEARLDLADYGADVHVDLPPADQVTTASLPSLLPTG